MMLTTFAFGLQTTLVATAVTVETSSSTRHTSMQSGLQHVSACMRRRDHACSFPELRSEEIPLLVELFSSAPPIILH